MCGKNSMEVTRKYRDAARARYPQDTVFTMRIDMSPSGKSFHVWLRSDKGQDYDNSARGVYWGDVVNRSGCNELRFRVPADGTDLRAFAAQKINQAVWGSHARGYTFV